MPKGCTIEPFVLNKGYVLHRLGIRPYLDSFDKARYSEEVLKERLAFR